MSPSRSERTRAATSRDPAPTAEPRFVAGVDIGGTNLRVGIVDGSGQVLRTRIVPSTTGLAPEANVTYLAEVIEDAAARLGLDRNALCGIGIGTTGPVDVSTGRIDNPFTLPAWSGVPLLGPLSERFGVPVAIDNDAAAAALGEYWRGAGVGSERMVMVTVGTGIGGALVVDGGTYRGASAFHPEMGHHVVDPSGPPCYCGARGCWEQLAAGPAIARDWQEVLRARGDNDARSGSEALFAAARAGDGDAERLVVRIGYYLGVGMQNVVAFLAPDLIVLGGGIARHYDLLEPAMQSALAATRTCQPRGGTALHASALGDEAGVIGAAYMVLR